MGKLSQATLYQLLLDALHAQMVDKGPAPDMETGLERLATAIATGVGAYDITVSVTDEAGNSLKVVVS